MEKNNYIHLNILPEGYNSADEDIDNLFMEPYSITESEDEDNQQSDDEYLKNWLPYKSKKNEMRKSR